VSGHNCFVLVFDYEASHPVFDDFRDGTSVECDDGRAASHCFDQNQAERLGPGDRRQQRDGAAEKARLFAVTDFADILDVGGREQLADFGFEIIAGDGIDLSCDLQRYPTAFGYPDRPLDSLFREMRPRKAK
jgi:hypothetical protein